jgi:predicted N-formylglutamate amidohydrolase
MGARYHDANGLECGVAPSRGTNPSERLLAEDEPPAFELYRENARSPYVITCDHASRRIPGALGSLGVPDAELVRHIAWDIGVAELGRKLADELDAWLILQNYSRLVIDCNRRPERGDSSPTVSEDTPIPGNVELSREAAALRAREIFEPYHARIAGELDARAARGAAPVMIFLHTFTPVFRGAEREWHAGVLYHRDARLAAPLLAALRREAGFEIGDNQPYAATALTDYGIVEHAERRGLVHVELEVRQDLLSDAEGQAAWAERLARLIASSARELGF